jgi:exopolyphosphatase / guanosine-5'-triphosphate,3'-diphosphate pyrophosphatase
MQKSTRRAVIDIGTNSVKLLVADVAGSEVVPVWESSKQTRLGRGFYETHRLQREAIEQSAQAVAEFARSAHGKGAVSLRAFATSAAREATNPRDLTQSVKQASGLEVEIISGAQEAAWAFRGVTTDPSLAKKPLLLVDVGGGSTEFILGRGREVHFQHSFQLGTVRLMESIPHSDPPKQAELGATRGWLKTFLLEEVWPKLNPAMEREKSQTQNHGTTSQAEAILFQLVGTGGTASILGRMEAGIEDYDRERIEGTRLTCERLRWHAEHLWSLPLEQRKQVIGLPENRADVILTGAAIFEVIMEQLRFTELRISTRGLRFAAVMEEAGAKP